MIVELIITLLVVGLLLWAFNNFVPLDANIKKIINVIVIILVVLFVLREFGLLDYLNRLSP